MPSDPRQHLPNSNNIIRVQLPNGICLLIYENHTSQSVVLSGMLDAGSIHEPITLNGLASMTATALMRGTQTRDFETLHTALEDMGADLSVGAGTHRVGFNGKSLAEDLPLLIELLSDILRVPSFPQAQVDRLRGERLTWLKHQEQDTRRQAARAFRTHLYPSDHPYHHATVGTLDTVPHLTANALRDFHAAYYSPHGMMLCVVGAVNALEVVDLVERWFGDWYAPRRNPAPVLPVAPQVQGVDRVFVPIAGKTQSDLILGVVGPSRFAPDFQAASLANSVLGQFGMMGRIGEVVREKSGMAYYAYSRLEGGMGQGAWTVSAGVNPKNIERAIDLSLNELRRISTELIDSVDLEDNQSYYVGRLPLQLESNEGLCGTILTMELYQLGLDYLLEYRDMIYRLTKDDLRAAVQNYWGSVENYVLAIAGRDSE